MNKPLVSIICLCYNQASFVQEAMESVWAQTYPAIELIVVDDGSSDTSVQAIQTLLKNRPAVKFIENPTSLGNCKAFNLGFRMSQGKYVIDLAADDVLLPERVERGVKALEDAVEFFGVHFSDAVYIDVEGKELRQHYKRDKNGALAEKVPQGWIYKDVVERYFICTPSMMMRRSVLDELNGYDELLAYEDFDFWVRSARKWKYIFSDQVLVKKRIVPGSWSERQYEKESRQLESTLKVCRKAWGLNKTAAENSALANRLEYEMRQTVRTGNYEIGMKLLSLKREVKPQIWKDALYGILLKYRLKILD